MNWLRLYHSTLDDPKVQGLPDPLFKFWINVLICASENHHRGVLPPIETIARKLGAHRPRVRRSIDFLAGVGLLEKRDDKYVVCNMPPGGKGNRCNSFRWDELRSFVFERDNFTCFYCGVRGGRLECDHKIPVSRGGSDDPENLVAACLSCNRSKHNQTPDEFIASMRSNDHLVVAI